MLFFSQRGNSAPFSRSVVSDSLPPHGLQHTRPPCPSPTPGVHSVPSIFPSIGVSSNELLLCIKWPKYQSFNFSISPSNDYSGLISFRIFAIFLRSREQVAVYTSLLALVGGSGNCLSAELCSCHGSVEEKRVENHSGVLWWSIVLYSGPHRRGRARHLSQLRPPPVHITVSIISAIGG